jgi:hypothetical protein
MKLARITDREIINESDMQLWFAVDGKPVAVPPGQKISLE